MWQIIHRKPELNIARTKCDGGDENLHRAVSIYLNSVTMAETICTAFDITCLFALQPLVLTKKPLGPIDQASLAAEDRSLAAFVLRCYDRIRHELARRPSFIDASQVLDTDQVMISGI